MKLRLTHFVCITCGVKGNNFFKSMVRVCFVQLFHSFWKGILHTCNHDLSLSKNIYIHTLQLHGNGSLYYRMLFNHTVHSLIKEALHILAPTRSSWNTMKTSTQTIPF